MTHPAPQGASTRESEKGVKRVIRDGGLAKKSVTLFDGVFNK